jgi:hypothetical protein
MAKQNTVKTIAGKQDGANKAVVYQEQQESNFHFSPEELKLYNEIYPNFGIDYLKNINEIPRELLAQDNQRLGFRKLSIIISFIVLLFFISITILMIYLGQYTCATAIIISGVSAVIVALLKGNPNKDKDE